MQKNLSPSLPDHREDAPVPTESWKEEVDDIDMPQIQDLLKKIRTRREAGVTGATIVWSWLQRRIQSLQRRPNFGYHYTGEGDLSRMSQMEIFEATALKYLKKAVGVTTVPVVPELFCADNASLPSEVDLYQSHPPKMISTRAYYPRV
ncbi:hypothetical protein PVAP13_1KG265800 [Panicum virgatum]|uniref:Uncharacterized protein n=1 Tax=Panicum virgatum TaxID=38727 RepID=A0A8T0XFY4_PANVG|nr:hypothetical protein PVAP13_1KG265800 [Panicum virgatum]